MKLIIKGDIKMGLRGINLEKWRSAIEGSGGIISTIAQRLGNSDYFQVKKKIFKTKYLLTYYLAESEKVSDIAESNIIKAIKNGDINVSKWYLQLKATERGYMEKKNIDVNVSFPQECIEELEKIFKDG